MLRKAIERQVVCLFPQKQLVVIATRSELVRVEIPLETAHFLTVTLECANVGRCHTYVAMHDGTISGTGCKKRFVPGERSDTTGMTIHRTNPLDPFRIPDLDLALVSTHGDRAASIRPLETGDDIALTLGSIRFEIAQLRDFLIVAVPKIDGG